MGGERKTVREMTPEERRAYWRERRQESRAGLCSGTRDARRNRAYRAWCEEHQLEPGPQSWHRFQKERGRR